MTYNADFLIAAMAILFLILWHFLEQKRAEDLNNQVFLIFVVLVSLDVAAEWLCNSYITSNGNFGAAAMISTTVFFLFQAVLPFTVVCYVQTLHKNRFLSLKKMLLYGIPTLILVGIVLSNPFTEKLFYFDVTTGYQKGPWYMLMYYSAMVHLGASLFLALFWRKSLGRRQTIILLEILLLSGGAVLVQLFHPPLLMTGFGLSLAVLALFITINNPYANTDTLTGLYNQFYLSRKSREMIAAKRTFHVITIYLYQLKHVNKVAGFQGGDRILSQTAQKLAELCGNRAFRITGKRFLIMTGSLEEYEYDLQKLKEMFSPDRMLDVDEHHMSVPVIISGIIQAQKLGDAGLVLEYAEYLESLAPQSGQTEVVQDDKRTMNGFSYQKKVEQYLHTAIQEDRFEVYYQPVYSVKEKRFVTLEALSRLQHPELGWIAPDVFIQIAERNHMIEQITDLQFQRICRFLNQNRTLMKQLKNVKVNLSSLDLMRNNCSEHFIRMMDQAEIPHDWIQFEITETVATEYNTSLRKIVEEFTAAGIHLCLDDFGSGYANLNTVMRLPFSVIKLDRTLLFDICQDENRALFYHSLVETFHRMNYCIVSEGVETKEEMELLSSWGVDMIQGYYFSKPLPKQELVVKLARQNSVEYAD